MIDPRQRAWNQHDIIRPRRRRGSSIRGERGQEGIPFEDLRSRELFWIFLFLFEVIGKHASLRGDRP